MESYQEIKRRHGDEFETLPIFWAFSNEQFEKSMEKIGLTVKDTDKICKIPGGGFCRKDDVRLFCDMILRHSKEMEEAVASDTTGEGFIFEMFDYELSNHEYSYTWDMEPTFEALGVTKQDLIDNPILLKGLNLAIKSQQAGLEADVG